MARFESKHSSRTNKLGERKCLGRKKRKEILCKHRRNPRKDDKESRKILVKAFLEPILTSEQQKGKFNLLNLGGKSSTMKEEKSGSLLSLSIANKQGKTRVDGGPSRQTRRSSLVSAQAFRSWLRGEEESGTSDNILKSHENVFSPTKGAQMTVK